MNAVIVEDEEFAAKRLTKLVGELAPEIEILANINSVETGIRWFKSNALPDLVFLDIQLNDGYGFDILDGMDDHPPVIFTTAYNEFAIRVLNTMGWIICLSPLLSLT